MACHCTKARLNAPGQVEGCMLGSYLEQNSMKLLLIPMALLSTLAAQPFADLILTNAKVWTVNQAQAEAEAVACLGPRIVAVGPAAEVHKWAGPRTQVVDLGGKLVVPGFNDAHVHFYAGAS